LPSSHHLSRARCDLRELSEEIRRIAAALARLAAPSPDGQQSAEPADDAAAQEVSAENVNSAIAERRRRVDYFPEELFGEPAWDMMLALLAAEISQRRVEVSSLCDGAGVPATTALRWLRALAEKGIAIERRDVFDARRVYVELSPEASRMLRAYFADLKQMRTT
jgi:DNA-binding transcriptional ArsR family regulator